MYQSLVEGRYVPWSLLVKDMPKSKHKDLDFIVDQLDWEANVDPKFKDNHYLEPVPVADTRKEGFVDRWIVYGKIDGEQLFTAKELTVEPGVQLHHQGQGRLRPHLRPGQRQDQRPAAQQPEAHPLHRADRGRILLHRRRRQGRRHLREHQRDRAARLPALLRARGEPGRPGPGRLPQEQVLKRVCIYCGSSPGVAPEYAAAARHCGTVLAQRGLTVVYGGGNVGLMGILADAALAASGEVIGIIPRRMIARELGHAGVTSLIPVDSMHQRKQKMADLADAFLALPGGIGTMEELFEAFTWLQLGLHHKPVGLLNVAGFYDRLIEFLAHMQAQRFLKPQHFASLLVDDDVERLLDRFARFNHQPVGKWMDRKPTASKP